MTDVEQQPGAPPAPPANSTEARTRLDTLIADKNFGAKLVAGDADANREFRGLQNLAASTDDTTIAAAMSGEIGEFPDSGAKQMANTAAMLREIGIREEIIEQTLRGHEVSADEFRLVEAYKARLMKDPMFVKDFLSGNPEARQKMTLIAIVQSGNVKGERRAW